MYSNLHLTISGLSFFYISYTHSTQYMMFQSQPATFFLMRPAVSYDPFRKLIRPLSITSSHWLVGTLAMSCFCSFLFGAAAPHCLLHNTGAKLHSCMHPKHGQSMRAHTNSRLFPDFQGTICIKKSHKNIQWTAWLFWHTCLKGKQTI